MQRDAGSLETDAALAADVAVVGAGPLGIVTALELADRGHRVVLIESGRRGVDGGAQALSDGAGADEFHATKSLAVRRQLGGTTSLWGGRCVPFDAVDFEQRDAVGGLGWPVTYEEIAAYLGRACDWCVCGKAIFNARDLPELAQRDLVPGLTDGEVRSTDLERWSLPTRFGKVYARALRAHACIDLITGLTCTEIVCRPYGSAVDHLELRSLGGQHATLRASRYVIATGGLEATRLLMASDRQHRGGIGNHSGHLGRWYMAHVEARVARVHLSTPPEETIHGHERDADGVYVRRRFTFDGPYQHRKGLVNGAIWFVNPELADPSHGSGILSGVYLTLISPAGRFLLAEAIRQAHVETSRPVALRRHVRNVLFDLLPAARFALTFTYQRFLRPGRKAPGFFVRSAANVYPIQYHGEHRPHRESRVELDSERDALGMPRLRTRLVFSDEDIASVSHAIGLLDTYLRAHEVGHVEYLADDLSEAVREGLRGAVGYHQTGTTRMSSSPEDGVLSADLGVHGFRDLFVASTSAFPTSSQANPTLMGVAFAVRLADKLSADLTDHALSGKAAPRRGDGDAVT